MHEIGLGGVLTFNAMPAVRGMAVASKSFNRLRGMTTHLNTGMSKLSMGFSRFQMVGALVGGISLAGIISHVKTLLRDIVDLENITMSVATNLHIIKDIPVAQSMAAAKDHMAALMGIAIETPGEIQDVANIWTTVLEPLSTAGYEIEKINQLTKGATIAAGALNVPYRDMAENTLKMMSGQIDRQSQTTIKLMGAARKLGIEFNTQAFTAMTLQERAEALFKLFGSFEAMSGEVGNTWQALLSTLKSFELLLFEAFASPVMEIFRREVIGGVGDASKMFEEFKNSATEMGKKLTPFFEGMFQGFKSVWTWGKQAFLGIKEALGGLGKGLDLNNILRTLGKVAAGFIILMGVLTPVISTLVTVGLFASVFSALGSVISGLASIFAAVGEVVLVVSAAISALFLVGKMQGKSFGQTISDAFNFIKEQALWVWGNVILPLWETLGGLGKSIYSSLKSAIPAALSVLEQLWGYIEIVIGAVKPVVLSVVGYAKTIIGAASELLPYISEAFSEWGGYISEVLSFLKPIFSVVVSIASALFSGFYKVAGFIVQSIVPVLKVVISFIGDMFHFTASILRLFKEIGSAIWEWLKPVTSWLGEKLAPAWDWVSQKIVKVGSVIKTVLVGSLKFLAWTLMEVLKGISYFADAMGMGAQFKGSISALESLATGKIAKAVAPAAGGGALAKGKEEGLGIWAPGMEAAFYEPSFLMAKQQTQQIKCPDIKHTAELHVDGKKVSSAMAKHKTEIDERSGSDLTPWQKKKALVKAVTP